jgi:transcriptional regulator with XRE-family HTH domain
VRKARPATLEDVRAKLRAAARDSGMTQQEIGVAMGFSKASARQAVSRLLNSEVHYDPRLTTLIQFAAAVNSSLPEILS